MTGRLSAVITRPDVLDSVRSQTMARARRDGVAGRDVREVMLSLHSPGLLECDALRGRDPDAPAALVWFEHRDPHWTAAATALLDDERPTACWSAPRAGRPGVEADLAEARRIVDDVLPESAALFDRFVAALLLVHSESKLGGSRCSHFGLIWQSPKAGRRPLDYAENLVHELIHQFLMLVDFVEPVFRSPTASAEPASLAPSAYLAVPRPYDLAFHSAMVALGLVEFWLAAGDRRRGSALLPNLMACLDGLDARRFCVTPFGSNVLDDLIECSLDRWHELVPELDAEERAVS